MYAQTSLALLRGEDEACKRIICSLSTVVDAQALYLTYAPREET